jgi:nucleoside-diphosphate-sugar epimerase
MGPVPVPGMSVLVDDVAKVHVMALDSSGVKGGESFLAASQGIGGTVWGDAIEIVNRNFPEEVKSGVLPNKSPAPTKRIRLDASKTEEVFDFKFASYEEQVKSMVKQYLEMVRKN